MQKDHLIQLHAFLVQIRCYIEKEYGTKASESFKDYDSLNIHPHEVHKSKDMQQMAIFELSKDISTFLAEIDPEKFERLPDNLNEYCQRLKQKIKK